MSNRPSLVVVRGLAASALLLAPVALARDAASLVHAAAWRARPALARRDLRAACLLTAGGEG